MMSEVSIVCVGSSSESWARWETNNPVKREICFCSDFQCNIYMLQAFDDSIT